jgi:hypothetical protein
MAAKISTQDLAPTGPDQMASEAVNNTGSNPATALSSHLQIGTAASGGFEFDAPNQVIATTFGTAGNLTLGVTDTGGGTTSGGSIFLGGSTRGDSRVNAITLSTAGYERVRVDRFGNVGIGTTAPLRALTVQGEASIVPSPANGTSAYLNVSDGTGSNGGNYSLNIRGLGNDGTAGVNLASVNVLADNFLVAGVAGPKMSVDSNGNVTIYGNLTVKGTIA